MQDRSPKISLNAKGPVVGALMLVFLILHTVFWVIPFYAIALIKVITPTARLRHMWTGVLAWISLTWLNSNIAVADFVLGTRWQIDVPSTLDKKGSYLLTSNHQSWVDILALIKALGKETPFPRFFLKQELIYVPLLGLCWWALDYPFMKRHSKEEIAKDPSLKGKDIETTKKACERYRGQPVTIMNFMEGTRYTPKKAAKSPYQHLIRPKAGGVAFVLNAMGDQIQSMLNTTIIYPHGARELWDYLCGRLAAIRVVVEEVKIPTEFLGGNYQTDEVYRANFQQWVSDLWASKDQFIADQLVLAKQQEASRG